MSTPTATANEPPSPSAKVPNNRWPSQVRFILGNEAAERFSYYGMKAILALYITNVLMQTRDQATNIIHLFGFANYFMPLVGAWVSDKLWGRYHTILWISLSYCVGHGVMAMSDAMNTIDGKVMCLYVGLGLIAFGSGGIKPCVSAFMGDQFKPDQRHLLQKAYAAFYWSINLGSTLSFFVIPFARKSYGYGWAFGIPGIAMGIATLVFWLGTRRYLRVAPTGDPKWLQKIYWLFMLIVAVIFSDAICRHLGMVKWQRILVDIGGALAIVGWVTRKFIEEVDQRPGIETGPFFAVLWYALTKPAARKPGGSFWDVARTKFSETSVTDTISVCRILSIFALVPVFWALFDQTFSTWVLQGAKMESYFFASDARYSGFGLRNTDAMAAKLASGTNAGPAFIWSQLSAESRQSIQSTNTSKSERKRVVIAELNNIIASGHSLYESNRFNGVRLSEEARMLVKSVHPVSGVATNSQPGKPGTGEGSIARLNRVLLDDLFPNETMALYRIGAEEMLSANPILVMILVPIMTLWLYPMMGRMATPLRRMSYGMFIAAASFIIVAMIQVKLDAKAELSILHQIWPYIVLTIAEVLVSTTGLEFAFREAAPSMKSTIMGFWNLTVALGNLLVTFITKFVGRVIGGGAAETGDASVTPAMFYFYAGLTFVIAILFSVVAAFYKYRDAAAAQGR